MCGIAGYFDAREPATPGRIRAMADRVRHRGPDAAGILLVDSSNGASWNGEGSSPAGRFDLALGHRRLSILDLSAAGTQPMASASGRHWIIFNGEIYNYVELRAELRALGHSFQTETDTEVLLAAYAQWGIDCVRRCNGMWAFALWDSVNRQLVLARDRLGVKPLYYATGPGWFVFGSEIKALLAHPRTPRMPNPSVVYDFLALGLADHTHETFFDGILRVPAAHYVTLKPGSAPQLHRYWDVEPNPQLEASETELAAATERFAELFEDAVRIRLRADVPIGTCLSGGVDSSSIVVTANRLMFDELKLDRNLVGDRQRTFSACFEDPRFDERKFIDLVIAATGASSHRVFPSGERLWDELPALVAQMDEPFHSTSQYSQYNVMRLVRESGVTVTLDGQGADELMAGYPAYHAVMLATLLRAGRFVQSSREALATLRMSGRGRSGLQLLARTAYGLLPAAITTMARTRLAPFASSSTESRSLGVIRDDLHRTYGVRREAWLSRQSALMHDLGARLKADVFELSLPCLLRYADRNSMAFSIESRMPLLDYRLVEHVFSLPRSLMVRDGWTKFVFRRAMQDRLPPAIQWRKDKMGFVTPEASWLRDGRQHLARGLSGTLASAEFLDPDHLRARLTDYVDGASESAQFKDVFRWYILETWMRSAFGSERTAA
jgi:asparagine synthase (glutamine-hydrolysing)